MQLNEFQMEAYQYACYQSPVYPYLALNEEAGEVAGKYGKLLRGDQGDELLEQALIDPALLPEEVKLGLAKELGDILWDVAAAATDLGFSLEEIGDINLAKLYERKMAGVIKGEGDER